MSIPTLNPLIARRGAPPDLAALPTWLCWRFEQVPGETKQRKVPVYASGGRRRGRHGSTEDRARLVTYAEAFDAAMARGWGVGFAPMPEWGITALDFDNCVSAGRVHPDVERLVAGTYAELSPSGRGVRAFLRGNLGNRKDAHGTPFGLEVFSSKGFVTVTGSTLDIARLTDSVDTVAEVSTELLDYCAQRFGRTPTEPPEPAPTSDTPPLGLPVDKLREALEVLDPSMPRADWLRVGMALHHETGGSAEGLGLWDTWSADGSTYPGPDDMAYRWDGFGRGGQTPVTVHALVHMANANGARIDLAAYQADEFHDLGPAEPVPVTPPRFPVIDASAFASRPLPKWIVRDVLPEAELVVLFGESTAGKSFVAQDLGEHIARGLPWRGKKVRPGRVAYVVAEGGGGFSKRLRAYEIEHKTSHEGIPFGVIHAAPNLLEHKDAVDVAKAIVAWGGADVVFVDTFAQTMPGANENAAEDVGKALAHCKGIHRATGAVVVLVHHAGKDTTKGARGWSGLKAAADAEIEVTRGVGGRAIRTSKQKDGDDGLSWGFDLKVVPVGLDEDGEVETSCVVVEAELPAVQQVAGIKRRLGKWEQHVVAVISEFAAVQTSGIEIQAVLDAAVEREPRGNENVRDTRRQHARRALTTLINEPDSPYDSDGSCISII